MRIRGMQIFSFGYQRRRPVRFSKPYRSGLNELISRVKIQPLIRMTHVVLGASTIQAGRDVLVTGWLPFSVISSFKDIICSSAGEMASKRSSDIFGM